MRRTWRMPWILPLSVPFAIASCTLEIDPPTSRYELVEMTAFGWADLGTMSHELSAGEVEAGGGMLSELVEITEAPTSGLIVLDRRWQKLVMFDDVGDVQRVIPLTRGDGPGEVLRLRGVTACADGTIHVLDDGRRRVLSFSAHGGYMSEFSMSYARPLGIRCAGDRLLLHRPARQAGEYALIFTTREGVPIDSLVAFSERDAQLSQSGESGSLGVDFNGTIAFAYPSAGRVHIVSAVGRDIGAELRPALVGTTTSTGASYSQIGTRAAGIWGDSIVVFAAVEMTELELPNVMDLRWSLHVLDASDGAVVWSVPLQVDGVAPSRVHVSCCKQSVYIAWSDPYPRIIEYALRPH